MENTDKKTAPPAMTNSKTNTGENISSAAMLAEKMGKKKTMFSGDMLTNQMVKKNSASSSEMFMPQTGKKKMPSPGELLGVKITKQQIPLKSLGNKEKDSVSPKRVIVPIHPSVSGGASKGVIPSMKDSVGAPSSLLTYGGGHLLTNVQVVTIFWGNAWTQTPQSNLLTQLNQFFDAILTSSLMDLIAQYSVSGQTIAYGSRIGTFTDASSEPGSNNTVSDDQVQQKIQALISNGNVTQPNSNTLYFVYLPPNVTLTGPTSAGGGTSCIDFCGYHWYIQGSTPEIYYAAMPFPSCNGCLGGLSQIDALTSVSSHELIEAITDPHPWTGWNSAQGEIGDICAWQEDTVAGYTVQKEWSNQDGACVVAPSVSGSGWSGWDSLGGWIDLLTVASNEDGRLEVFGRGGDGAVWHNWQTAPNNGWGGWYSLGGWIDILTVGKNQDGRLEIFARGGDGAVWHNWQLTPNGDWSGWNSLGGWIDLLTVANNQDGRLELFARGGDGAVWHNWQTAINSGWSGWDSLGGWIDMLAVEINADGRLEIFARGGDAAVWHNWQTAPNNGWSGWDSLGGWIDMLSVNKNQDGRMEIFARGGDGAVWHNWQTAPSNGWSGWGSLGGWIDRLTTGNNEDGRIEIFARGGDGAVWHNWQTAPNF